MLKKIPNPLPRSVLQWGGVHPRPLAPPLPPPLGAREGASRVFCLEPPLAISQIFSITEWPADLEIWVWGRSRSFKMAQFDRLCTTFYWSAIVTIAPSCTIFELFDVE